jgi:hypothetical protein
VLGLHLIHPKSGLGSAIGSASSTLDVVKKEKDYSINDRVMVNIRGTQPSPWLGQIKAITPDAYIIDSDKSLITIPKENVTGKNVVLLPFFGYLYSIFGK